MARFALYSRPVPARVFVGAAALAAAWPSTAASDVKLLTADTLEVAGDVRLAAVDGERGWLEGGWGRLRSSGNGSFAVRPELGDVDLVWTPQLGFALSAVVVGALQGGPRTRAGLSQAYLDYRPLKGANAGFSGRLGLLWPPISLEHEGADWHVRDSITPSAINSWIGEEVKPIAAEGTLALDPGGHKLRLTAALMGADDTAGTLLSLRGWALHDRTTLAFVRQPLPPLSGDIAAIQAPYTHPLADVHSGFLHRPGYYAKLAWQPPLPIRLEAFHYDNRANPEDVDVHLEWGWRTKFDNLGLLARIGPATLRAQALSGRTRMGFVEGGRRWFDNRFRSAFALLSLPVGSWNLSGRLEAFGTRNRGSLSTADYDDDGWSGMLAAKRQWGSVTGLAEYLHVSSRMETREDGGLRPRQAQDQVQAALRMRW